MARSEQTFLVSAFEPHTSLRGFTVLHEHLSIPSTGISKPSQG